MADKIEMVSAHGRFQSLYTYYQRCTFVRSFVGVCETIHLILLLSLFNTSSLRRGAGGKLSQNLY